MNLSAGEVEVCRAPSGGDDAAASRVGRGSVVEPELLPGATIAIAALLG